MLFSKWNTVTSTGVAQNLLAHSPKGILPSFLILLVAQDDVHHDGLWVRGVLPDGAKQCQQPRLVFLVHCHHHMNGVQRLHVLWRDIAQLRIPSLSLHLAVHQGLVHPKVFKASWMILLLHDHVSNGGLVSVVPVCKGHISKLSLHPHILQVCKARPSVVHAVPTGHVKDAIVSFGGEASRHNDLAVLGVVLEDLVRAISPPPFPVERPSSFDGHGPAFRRLRGGILADVLPHHVLQGAIPAVAMDAVRPSVCCQAEVLQGGVLQGDDRGLVLLVARAGEPHTSPSAVHRLVSKDCPRHASRVGLKHRHPLVVVALHRKNKWKRKRKRWLIVGVDGEAVDEEARKVLWGLVLAGGVEDDAVDARLQSCGEQDGPPGGVLRGFHVQLSNRSPVEEKGKRKGLGKRGRIAELQSVALPFSGVNFPLETGLMRVLTVNIAAGGVACKDVVHLHEGVKVTAARIVFLQLQPCRIAV